MALLTQVAEEIAAAIGGEVDYVPEYELGDFKAEKILVAPIGNEYNDLTRGSREVIVSVEVGIIQRLKENNLPAMLEKVEDMVQTIQNLKLVNNRGYVRKITNTPAYDVQSMVSNKLFITVMQLEVRVM